MGCGNNGLQDIEAGTVEGRERNIPTGGPVFLAKVSYIGGVKGVERVGTQGGEKVKLHTTKEVGGDGPGLWRAEGLGKPFPAISCHRCRGRGTI